MKIEGISTEWVFLVYALRRLKIEIFVNKKKNSYDFNPRM